MATTRSPRILPLHTFLVLLLVLSLESGCRPANSDRVPVYPVEGQITLNGQPLADAYVVLHPRHSADSRVLPAQGKTDLTGRFQLSTYELSDGASAGEYTVTVQKHLLQHNGDSFTPGPNCLSPAIATPDRSNVRVCVVEGPTQLAPIEVRR